MTIDSSPNRFVSAVMWPLALVAGYAAAVIANIEMFLYCGRETCYSASLWSTLPGWVGIAVGCWFVRHRSSYSRAALAGAGVAVAVVASGAPVWAQNPMSFSMNRFPGDFVLSLLAVPLSVVSLVLNLYFLLAAPNVAGGALCALVMRTGSPASSNTRRARFVAAAVLMAAAILVELTTTPTAWSPRVHRRIAEFELSVPPGTGATPYRAWARKEVHFSVSTSSSAGAVLGFYDRVFDGWRRLDRTADDGIWIDPTGTVMAWAHITNGYASVSLNDFDRASWQQRFRRTSRGDRIVDLIQDGQ